MMYTRARKIIDKLFGIVRPSSYPFITGDSFRKLADFIYDETQKCTADEITEKSIVFVKSDMLLDFFENIHPRISNPYILISHNSDENIDGKYLMYIDNKIIHWFAQNNIIQHPKITPIPIGLENLHFRKNGNINNFIKIRNKKISKTENQILSVFSKSTNLQERTGADNETSHLPIIDKLEKFLPPKKYLEKLAKYKFILSPPGNGIDCIRTWESLYLDTVPILKNNANTSFFHNLNLPILKVDNWKDLEKLSENDLKSMYDMIMSNCNKEALWIDYWINRIKNEQN